MAASHGVGPPITNSGYRGEAHTGDPDHDPVAANLVKVINILNKHHLTDGLDLKCLKESIGFEQESNNRKLALGAKDRKQETTVTDRKSTKMASSASDRSKVDLETDTKVKSNNEVTANGNNEVKISAFSRRDYNGKNVDRDIDGSYLGVVAPTKVMSRSNSNQVKVTVDESDDLGGDDKKDKILRVSPPHSSDSGRGSSQHGASTDNLSSKFKAAADTLEKVHPKSLSSSSTLNTEQSSLSATKYLSAENGHINSSPPRGDGVSMDNMNHQKSYHLTSSGALQRHNKMDVNDNDLEQVGGNSNMVAVCKNCCYGDSVSSQSSGQSSAASRAAGVEDFKVFYWKIEVEEWGRINRQLRQHGLPPVEILHPKKASGLSDTVVLEPEMARLLRQTLHTLMKDCDRRQGLVQELIVTNNHLRDDPESSSDLLRNELSEQTSTTEKYESRARDLKAQLDTSRTKVEDLEENRLIHGSSSEEERLRNTKNAIQARCRELQKKVEDQKLEIDMLHAQLKHAQEQDEKLKQKHEEALLKLKKQIPKNSRIDDKTLDVIDSYERQIYSLRRQLELKDDPATEEPVSQEATPNYKALIKSYERDIRDTRKKAKEFENENQLLKIDLQSRPEMKDFRTAQQKIKKLERALREHNIRLDSKGQLEHMQYSSRVEDLDFLPLAQCQHHLRNICIALGAEDVEHVTNILKKQKRALEAQPKMEEFAQKVLTLTNTPGLPVPREYANRHKPHSSHEVWCDKTWHHVLPTLEHWVTQLKGIKELQRELIKLTAALSASGMTGLDAENPSITKMITAIRSIHSDDNKHQTGNQTHRESVSRAVLQGIVDHFMTLFDVAKISGVYARMNDVYTKLGEVHNTMNTLKSLLSLPNDARGSAVVDATARVCQTHNKVTAEQLKELLNVDDLNSVVRMLEEHREFFPVFQEIMSKLMEICGCHRLDQVVPTVRAIKMLAA